MKKSSIFLWITIIFLLGFLGIAGAYVLSLKYIDTAERYQRQKRFDYISQSIIFQIANFKNPDELLQNFESLDLVPIMHLKEVRTILDGAKPIKKRKFPIGQVIVLKKRGHYYYLVQSFGNVILLKDIAKNMESLKVLYTTIFAVTLGLLLLIYILMLLKLRPLKKITKEIGKFSQGQLDLDLDIQGFKELTEVANALDNAAQSLKSIQNSRKLLLRNIMHELKTPITKGRIQAEMVEDPKQRQRLVQIFEKLNSLINELAAIEAVNSKIKPNFEQLPISDILDEAINIGMFDKNDLTIVKKANPAIQADYRLMAIALKNLIDNALKYASDGHVTIVIDDGAVHFTNLGTKLQAPLEHYLEPFSKEGKKSGFGLGLYLVDNILRLHGFSLRYRYEEGKNIFSVTFK